MLNDKHNELFYGLLVALAAFLVYANSLGNGYVLDDESVILNNPALKGSLLSVFKSIDTTGESQLLPYYRPFTYLTFIFERWLHDLNPVFVRLFNVTLHSVNSFLVYKLSRKLFKEQTHAALLAALLFAVHPIQSEGVDFNAGGRNTMLVCLFSLMTFLYHSLCISRKQTASAILAALLFTLGLFSKESALMLLPFIVGIELQGLRNKISTRLHSFLRILPYLASTSFYIVMRWMTLSKLGIQTSIIPGFGAQLLESMYITEPLAKRLLNNLYIIPHYLTSAIWPATLSSRYMIPDDLHRFALPLFAAWIIIFCFIVYIVTKGRSNATLFGVTWLFLFWLPLSGIVIIPGSQMADRFIYIPAIGLWIMVSDQLQKVLANVKPEFKKYTFTGIALIVVILAGTTIRRNMDWKDNYTLYTRFVMQYPENVHARAGLGKVYYGATPFQNPALAEQEFEKVVSLDPTFPMIYTYLGNIKLNKEDLADALYCYTQALAVNPIDKEALVNRGITLEKLGRPNEAIKDYLFFLTSPGSTDTPPFGREHAEKRLKELSK